MTTSSNMSAYERAIEEADLKEQLNQKLSLRNEQLQQQNNISNLPSSPSYSKPSQNYQPHHQQNLGAPSNRPNQTTIFSEDDTIIIDSPRNSYSNTNLSHSHATDQKDHNTNTNHNQLTDIIVSDQNPIEDAINNFQSSIKYQENLGTPEKYYYFPDFDRKKAEETMSSHGLQVGQFLVRPRSILYNNGQFQNYYVLSLVDHYEEFHHFKIVDTEPKSNPGIFWSLEGELKRESMVSSGSASSVVSGDTSSQGSLPKMSKEQLSHRYLFVGLDSLIEHYRAPNRIMDGFRLTRPPPHGLTLPIRLRKSSQISSPLHLPGQPGFILEGFQYLLNKTINGINNKTSDDNDNENANNYNLLYELLQNISLRNSSGETPLHYSTKMLENINANHERVIRNFNYFIDFLIQPIKNHALKTLPAIKTLYDFHANINEVDMSSNSLLHRLCGADVQTSSKIHPKIIVQIIEDLIRKHKANPRVLHPEHGWTPAHFAAYNGKVDVLAKLGEISWVLMELRDFSNKRPIDLAIEKGNKDCIILLENFQMAKPKPLLKVTDFIYEIDRSQAQRILEHTAEFVRSDVGTDGLFLMRRRNMVCELTGNLIDRYVLSCVYNKRVFHYEILLDSISQGSGIERWYNINGGPKFESLDQLVEYYRNFSDGLPGILRTACGRDNKGLYKPIYAIANIQNLNNYNYTEMDPVALQQRRQNQQIRKRKNIPDHQIILDSEVGRGEFGLVYAGQWIYDDKKKLVVKVALKSLFKDQNSNAGHENNRELFLQEADIMLDLEHHCIVRLFGLVNKSVLNPTTGRKETNLMMVQEFVSYNGISSLLDYIRNFPDDCQTNDFIIWSSLICSGMKYLEERNYVHRDLALRNILIKNKQDVKISDFGLSRAVLQESEEYTTQSGGKWPVRWYAPESVNYGKFSSKSDVWSFGVTLWEMFSFGEQPYSGKDGTQVREFVERGGRLPKPRECPDKIYRKMKECWLIDPGKRPSFAKLKMYFFKNPDYLEINFNGGSAMIQHGY